MKIAKKRKLSIKKIILSILAIFVALLVLISLFAGNYLVNYSIGRSGDGGNRTVALEIPETPLMYTANLFAITKAGYSFKEASALDQVKNCEKPMLFIHGTADDFIPYDMMDTLYQAKPGDNKEKITAPGAGHGEAMYLLGDEYWNDVFTFLNKFQI